MQNLWENINALFGSLETRREELLLRKLLLEARMTAKRIHVTTADR